MRTKQSQAKLDTDRNVFPPECHPKLEALFAPHVQSFNYFLDEGLREAVKDLDPVEIMPKGETDPEKRMTVWISEVQIGYPSKKTLEEKLYPSECRQGMITYSVYFNAIVNRRIGDSSTVESIQKPLGRLPIMVKSSRCRLAGLTPKELVAHHEEPFETGGYFITNGLERLIRLLVVPRRNYVMALVRPSFSKRGPAYTHYGATIRCVRAADQSAKTITLHYLSDGTVNLRFTLRKQEYFVPVVLLLKALVDTTDREIYEHAVGGDTENTFLTERVELLLREAKRYGLFTREQCLSFLGSRFRVALSQLPERTSDVDVATYLIRKVLFIHLDTNRDKFYLLLFMIRKLYALVNGEIREDDSDSPAMQELLLPGHLYLMYLKELLQEWLYILKGLVLKDLQPDSVRARVNFTDSAYFKRCLDKTPDLGKKLEYFLKTGNLVSPSGLDLMQATGYVITAERLNFLRYVAHFRSVHRGQFFAAMKTTGVRKLQPSAWGFLCPVHTPDGAPCGLLNHLAAECRVVVPAAAAAIAADARRAAVALWGSQQPVATGWPPLEELASRGQLVERLVALGMRPVDTPPAPMPRGSLPILVDGRVAGWVASGVRATALVDSLRELKVRTTARGVPPTLEVAYVPAGELDIPSFPGIYIFSGDARMMRPVRHLATGGVEWLGTMEQPFLNVACLPGELHSEMAKKGSTANATHSIADRLTHAELAPTNILSVVASLTPFSDYNQSPRNMYQCQMGKQSMAIPCHAYNHRVDGSLYRLTTPQVPLVRTETQDALPFDEYPTGTNAIVAVISYTGYDMEDAMIVNKAAYERGFAHGALYKTVVVDLEDTSGRLSAAPAGRCKRYLCNLRDPANATSEVETPFDSAAAAASAGTLVEPELEPDGLPPVGVQLRHGDPFYVVFDESTGRHEVVRFKYKEPAYVDEVRVMGTTNRGGPGGVGDGRQKAVVKLRFVRNPVIGDKFSSRHGQKGVLSQLWPQENMPFSESGMTPDVIINPNAFPSRMTIGMLIESMAGKAGALRGEFSDATPFKFDENRRVVDHIGKLLIDKGFHYYGNEPFYSGITGTEFPADIYFGVVYYQRLRHMVSDKYQVRATGPINNLTRQPVKGRKAGGGIRFGEMERDSLLAHGVSFTLHDRLMNSSDFSKCFACTRCGSILSPVVQQSQTVASQVNVVCRVCESSQHVRVLAIPYVFRYLAAELASMNIKLSLHVA